MGFVKIQNSLDKDRRMAKDQESIRQTSLSREFEVYLFVVMGYVPRNHQRTTSQLCKVLADAHQSCEVVRGF